MPFAVKLPCRAPRALAEHFSPPELVPHDILDYPVYYDALYYPQYHTRHFETPQTLCSWLLKSLQTHHDSCSSCSSPFAGCVTFDGVSIVIGQNNTSFLLSLSEFERPAYRHCTILAGLATCGSCSVASSITSRLAHYPPWLYYDDGTIEHNVAALSVPVLKQCVIALHGSNDQLGSKAVLVRTILQSFQSARSELHALSYACATIRLLNVELPSSCGRHLLPLLCARFVTVFGADVAAVLRHPPPAAYAVHPCPVSQIPWMSLSTEELVRRLVYTFYRESPSSYAPPNLLVREILDIGDAADDVHGNILIVKHVKGNKHVVVDVTGGDIAIVDSIIKSAVARSDSIFWL